MVTNSKKIPLQSSHFLLRKKLFIFDVSGFINYFLFGDDCINTRVSYFYCCLTSMLLVGLWRVFTIGMTVFFVNYYFFKFLVEDAID